MSDREYARPGALPDWLESFADEELKKEGNPFDDIRELFKTKDDVEAVEARVEELRKLVGLDNIEKHAAAKDDIFGGVGDESPEERYDREQLEKGVKVELEHTNDPELAKEIAKDHLEESKDFKDGTGAKYYDRLDEMEEEMEEDLSKKKAKLLINLVAFAQALEDEGMPEAATMVDEKIKSLQDDPLLAKDKDVKELPEKYHKYTGLDEFIQNACRTSGGHASVPAIVDRIRKEFDDEMDVKNKGLEGYIKHCLEAHEEKTPGDRDNGHAGEYVAIIVTDDDDGNQRVFDDPTGIR